MSNETIFSLSPMMKQGCEDLLRAFARKPNQHPLSEIGAKKARWSKQAAKVSTFTDILPGQSSPRHLAERKAYLQTLNSFGTAWALLPVYLARIPSGRTDFALRAQIDRTAILIRHKSAAIASVLHPMQLGSQVRMLSSIMPLLARAHGDDQEVEGLLRPRMPTITIPTLAEETELCRTSKIHSPTPESHQAVSVHRHTDDGTHRRKYTNSDASGSPQATVASSVQPTQELHIQPIQNRQSYEANATVPLPMSRQKSVHRLENETEFAYNILQPPELISSMEDTHIDKRPRLEKPLSEVLSKSFGTRELSQLDTKDVRVYRTGDLASAAIDSSSAAVTVSTAVPNLERQARESDDEFVIPTLCLDTDSEDGQGSDQVN